MANISEIQEAVVPIAHHYGVKRLYLFGSYSKGTANEKSDIDLLVEKGKPMSLLQLSGMRQMIQEALQLSVDLITTTGVEENFRTEIAGTEILLYEE
ncbi:MAG: nucleotidyltransferase domain-containing protein [Bacillus sp. (in: Bacteria)]|nr:nucleotidyltransferase domain-containing protein [Bacillus sp. (in: firmicutes)]MCM1427037.1 nucleotidyltransferase domain-containing protein [Eubacterium sp.]